MTFSQDAVAPAVLHKTRQDNLWPGVSWPVVKKWVDLPEDSRNIKQARRQWMVHQGATYSWKNQKGKGEYGQSSRYR
ncbi:MULTISPECIES: hypothetical protein [Mangrovibacter]|uniref:hypothetical protein n=1 Tax=Mangrovibacter TaxID=451512 RepID=UPI0011B3D04C|nr:MULTISPECIES: hypothetical protein [Mangrovibacter]